MQNIIELTLDLPPQITKDEAQTLLAVKLYETERLSLTAQLRGRSGAPPASTAFRIQRMGRKPFGVRSNLSAKATRASPLTLVIGKSPSDRRPSASWNVSVTGSPHVTDDETVNVKGRTTTGPPGGIDPKFCGPPVFVMPPIGRRDTLRS